MYCKSRTRIKNPNTGKEMYVNCKKCLPCKIQHTAEWTMRLEMELMTNPNARFITLTYNDDNLPDNKTLIKDDVSKFMKSLRQELHDYKLRMFSCGEYGDETERPHYHMILYGITGTEQERIAIYNSWKKCDEFFFLGSEWRKACGTVTHDSCCYVASYCQKKKFGDYAKEEYENKGRIPPFQLQSQKLGETYFLQHIEEYKKLGYIPYNGIKMPIPDVWKRKFNIESDYQFEVSNEIALKFIRDNPEVTLKEYRQFEMQHGITLNDLAEWDDVNRNLCHETALKIIARKNNLKEKKL